MSIKSSTKSIDTEEAASAMRMINEQSTIAQEAIARVKNSPSQVPTWQGNRRQQFDEAVQEDMRRLDQAVQLIDQAAERIRVAIERFSAAD